MSIELQNIDCNCNNCIFMERDIEKYNSWKEKWEKLSLEEFNKEKSRSINIAKQLIINSSSVDEKKNGEGMLRVAEKMRFQFDKTGLINYGKCSKFNKEITFIPNICQLDTQTCFKNRRE